MATCLLNQKRGIEAWCRDAYFKNNAYKYLSVLEYIITTEEQRLNQDSNIYIFFES